MELQAKIKQVWIRMMRITIKNEGRKFARSLYIEIMNAIPLAERKPIQEAYIEIFTMRR